MYLVIDTTTEHATLLLIKENKVINTINYDSLNDHTYSLYENLRDVDLNLIKEIYVINGPGSFTGTRIGVLFAKTLAHEKKIKLFSINKLECFYYMYNKPVAFDARGNKYFMYDGKEYNLEELKEGYLVDPILDVDKFIDNKVLSKFEETNSLLLEVSYMKDVL